MTRKKAVATIALVCMVAASAVWAGAVSAQGPGAGGSDSIASYDGKELDLAQSWGGAQACFVDVANHDAECFDSRQALEARESELASAGALAPLIDCSSPLKLFENTSYGGRELDLYARAVWTNLSDWSFDNQTSSYKVGACSVDLAENANGGGSLYPGTTSAGHNEASMQSGWDNRVSSVWIT